SNGVIMAGSQSDSVGMTQNMYADLILTLLEDGYLHTGESEIYRGLSSYARTNDPADRDFTLNRLRASKIYLEMSVTYRGLRRIDELRDQLRRDRVLEKFGILLDGRYIVSDLIYFLERVNGASISLLLADVA